MAVLPPHTRRLARKQRAPWRQAAACGRRAARSPGRLALCKEVPGLTLLPVQAAARVGLAVAPLPLAVAIGTPAVARPVEARRPPLTQPAAGAPAANKLGSFSTEVAARSHGCEPPFRAAPSGPARIPQADFRLASRGFLCSCPSERPCAFLCGSKAVVLNARRLIVPALQNRAELGFLMGGERQPFLHGRFAVNLFGIVLRFLGRGDGARCPKQGAFGVVLSP